MEIIEQVDEINKDGWRLEPEGNSLYRNHTVKLAIPKLSWWKNPPALLLSEKHKICSNDNK